MFEIFLQTRLYLQICYIFLKFARQNKTIYLSVLYLFIEKKKKNMPRIQSFLFFCLVKVKIQIKIPLKRKYFTLKWHSGIFTLDWQWRCWRKTFFFCCKISNSSRIKYYIPAINLLAFKNLRISYLGINHAEIGCKIFALSGHYLSIILEAKIHEMC